MNQAIVDELNSINIRKFDLSCSLRSNISAQTNWLILFIKKKKKCYTILLTLVVES